MRGSLCWIVVLTIAAIAPGGRQGARVNPERILADHFQFSSAEVAQARQGQPVVKVQADREQLKVIGAIRLPGKKERLSDWVKNIEHFRGSAQLGAAHVIPSPPAAAAFAQVTLDSADLADLRRCRPENCAMRLPSETLAQMQREPSRANDIIRELMLGYTAAYLHGGWAGVADMRTPLRTSPTEPIRLCGTSWRRPRCWTCGSLNTSSSVLSAAAGTSACAQSGGCSPRLASSCHSTRNVASTSRKSSSDARARRYPGIAARAYGNRTS